MYNNGTDTNNYIKNESYSEFNLALDKCKNDKCGGFIKLQKININY